MISAKVHIKFNESVISSIEKGVDHLKSVLSTGSSQEICIPVRSLNQLCNLHTDVDVQILDKDERNCTVDLSIDYPICMCGKGSGISTFLGALLYYTVFSFVDEYSIYNFDLINEAAYDLFTGPKHGVTGIRELCEEREQPLIGLILKPRTKIDLSYQSTVVERLARSKSINYIIDDELVISSVCCPYEEKIDCYSALVNKIKAQYSHTMLYWVNVSCDIPIAERIIEYSLKKGVSTFSLNAVTMGFTSVKYIIDKYSSNALFLINNIGRGILTRQKGFFISELVLSKISRLIGADAVYTGPITKDFPYNDCTLKEERVALQNVWGSYKKSFCVSSGNIDNAKNAKENIQALGKDTMIQMGAGLLRKDNRDTISKLSVVRFMVSNALNQEIMHELELTFSLNENSTGEKSMKHERRDFFISYNVADESWAKWIAETLENNGYKTFIQAWDIKPGDDFIVRMQEFLTNSERFLPILSSTYLDAPYCQAEWLRHLQL